MKECNKCNEKKFLNNFRKGKTKDGYRNTCNVCEKEYFKKYREENKEKRNQYSEKQREKQTTEIKINKADYMKKYRLKNKINILKKQYEYINRRKENDKLFSITINIRKLISNSFNRNGFTKKSRTHDILGCTFDEFKEHLESQFESWMNWDNYGLYNGKTNHGWDIDHKIPSSSAKTEEDVIKLNHYTNLRPLCSYINRVIKKNK
jgi:hypothetical protein